jgi:hypothetical protein
MPVESCCDSRCYREFRCAVFPCSRANNRDFSIKWGVLTDTAFHNPLLYRAFLYDFPVLNYQGIWRRVSGNACLKITPRYLILLPA